MGNEITPTPDRCSFEELRRANQHGAEYWSARDLQPLLGYSQWRRFEEAVQRAITSCQQSGNDPAYHFAGAGKLIEHGKGGKREVPDFHLSRVACYLIAQNGDPRKPAIAEAIKQRKNIPAKENLMDRMDTTELAANQFRMTQARDKLKRDGVRGELRAIEVHRKVGQEVRGAIARISGTSPELLPPAEHIKEVKKRLKGAKPVLELDDRDAKGLVGGDDLKGA